MHHLLILAAALAAPSASSADSAAIEADIAAAVQAEQLPGPARAGGPPGPGAPA